MKRIFRKSTLYLLIVTLLCSALLMPTAAEETTAGKTYAPTENWAADEDGVYTISNAQDLAAFYSGFTSGESYSGKTVKLTADLELNPGWNAASGDVPTYIFKLNSGWTFKGTFDGQGHSISGYYAIPDSAVKFLGFFPQASGATICNLSLVNSFIGSPGVDTETGESATGSIVGAVRTKTKTTTFRNLYVDAIVASTNPENSAKFLNRVGGICGQLFDGPAAFESCIFAGTVSGVNSVGGILGTNINNRSASNYPAYRADMTDCAVYGTVRADSFNDEGTPLRGWGKEAGGFIGREGGNAALTRCLFFGDVKAAENQYNGTFAYLDRGNNDGDPIDFHLTDCYTYDGANRNGYAIGLHNSRINFNYHITYTSASVDNQYNQEALIADLNGDRSVMKDSVVKLSSNTASALYGIAEYDNWRGVGDRLYPVAVADMIGFEAYAVKSICVQQGTEVTDGNTSLRFLAVLDDIDLNAFSEIGFEVCISNGVKTEVMVLRGNSVFTSVIAAGESVSAETLGGKWIFALEVLNIPVSGIYTFTVRPVMVNASGTAFIGAAGVTELVSGVIAE